MFSPLVDDRGNSVRGVGICEEFSRRLGFHLFRTQTKLTSPIREISSAAERRSVRIRSTGQTAALEMNGHRIGVVETQVPWSFVACERFMRAVDAVEGAFLVVETSRVGFVDATARILMQEFFLHSHAVGRTVMFAGPLPPGLRDTGAVVHMSLDVALEWCDDELLARLAAGETDLHHTTIAQSDLAQGLDRRDLAALEAV